MIEHVIEKLPEELINQIKAGEVVERPASVVKELVENSIDAQSTFITVELLDGGKQLIRITDNGIGIPAKSLENSLERHATSKLKLYTDLEKIKSFGFRGEALPSIASVSEFNIKSKPENQKNGQEIIVSQGKIISKKDVILSKGTVIQVKDLFCNVPARLKFLKSTSTEYSHIYDFLMSISFYYYNISFKLIHNGREVFYYKQKNSPLKRFEEIMCQEAFHYAPVTFERGTFKLTGFCLLPEKATGLCQYFITFVNGRLVKDKVIRAGVLQAYQGLLVKGLTPNCVVFIEVDPNWIDVNVHPAKIEVRFADPLAVQELIAIGIQNSIKSEINKNLDTTRAQGMSSNQKSWTPHYEAQEVKKPHMLKLRMDPVVKPRGNEVIPAEQIVIPAENIVIPAEAEIHTHKPYLFENAKYLGQYSNCYLMLEKETKLLFLDQHAFHERILFEEYSRDYSKKAILKQTMLTPYILNSTPQMAALVTDHIEKISSLGFEIEILTNSNLAIHTYPSFLSYDKIQTTVEEILNKIVQNENTESAQLYHLFYATLACHTAVRSGDALNEQMVQRLLLRSKDVDFFAHCPHGRPVLRQFEKKEVESWFLRI